MSIRGRLLLASLLVLPLFLGLSGLVLDRAFHNYQLYSKRDSMRLQHLLLARAAEWADGGWRVENPDEPRLSLPDSGTYAAITGPGGELRWMSPSASGFGRPWRRELQLVATGFAQRLTAVGSSAFSPCSVVGPYLCHAQRVAWGSNGPEALFLLVEDATPMLAQRQSYRQQLLALALAVTVMLLCAQALVLGWGLQPLRRVATAIRELEQGGVDSLEGNYPAELQPLTENLKQLLASERRRRQRVRNAMDRLTHVLKSPLMLIRNSGDSGTAYRELVDEQVTRMIGVVEGELARARLDGRAVNILGTSVPVKPLIERIAAAYGKLPRPAARQGLPLQIDTAAVDPGASFSGEERDLQDLVGTLLENAMKYGRERIEIAAFTVEEAAGRCLQLVVEDDGDGIPPGLESVILVRGARADTVNLGQGLGLSIVIEIVSAYDGSLRIHRSSLGGARFVVTFPG